MRVTQIWRMVGVTSGIGRVLYELSLRFQRNSERSKVCVWRAMDAEALACPVVLPLAQLEKLPLPKRLLLNITIPVFTIVSSLFVLLRRSSLGIVIVHGDCLVGDIFVAHSCHLENLLVKFRAKDYRVFFNPLHWFMTIREWVTYKLCHFQKVVCVSESVADEVARLYGVPRSRLVTIPNGVALNRFHPGNRLSHGGAIRAEYNIPSDARVLLFVGNEFHRKGLGYVIDALAHLNDRRYCLLVVGADNPAAFSAQANRLGVGDRVIFAGRQSAVEHYYAASDLFVFPVNYEPFGLVGIEAMAAGVPMLGCPVGGIRSYLQHGVNGYFIERDSKQIASLIMEALDAGRWPQLSEAARSTAEEFSWDFVFARYVDVVRSLQGE